MYVDECYRISDFIWESLLHEPIRDGITGVTSARVTGEELTRHVRHPGPHYASCQCSVVYASIILRQFREAIIERFFKDYPQACWLHDWREVASAVVSYTMHGKTFWLPTRGSIVDAKQKMCLLGRPKYFALVKFHQTTDYLCWQGGYVKVKSIAYRELTFDLNHSLIFTDEVKAAA